MSRRLPNLEHVAFQLNRAIFPDVAKVAVITRTQNRPVLLRRAMQSILGQTFNDLLWVIVNDAGHRESSEAVAEQATSLGIATEHIYRDTSVGMEAASNNGVQGTTSDYVVIHDDDDSWHPEFLQQTVDFLDTHSHYKGVVSQCMRIDEEVATDTVEVLSESPYNLHMMSVQISDMLLENQFPPISFLFRRSLYQKLGGFDESLPVLGDWDFHLRALLEGDVGVIPVPLANYHFRAASSTNVAYGNSLVTSVDKHIEFDARFRNAMFRRDVADNSIGIGVMVVLARQLLTIDRKLNIAEMRAQKLKRLLGKIPLLGRLIRR